MKVVSGELVDTHLAQTHSQISNHSRLPTKEERVNFTEIREKLNFGINNYDS